MTFSIMTFSIMTFSIMTFNIMTFSIMTFSIKAFKISTLSKMTLRHSALQEIKRDIQHIDIQQNGTVFLSIKESVIMLSVMAPYKIVHSCIT